MLKGGSGKNVSHGILGERPQGCDPVRRGRDLPALPIILLLLGALATWLARRQHERVWWAIAAVAAVITWGVCLGLVSAIPAATRLSVWRPVDLFASRLELILDPIGWRFIYGTSTLLVTVLLTAVARPGEATPLGRAMMLGYAALGMMAMLAGNLLSVATAWALMDLVMFVFLLGSVGKAPEARGLVTRLAVDGGGVLLVVGAAVADWAAGGGRLASARPTSPLAIGLLALAVLLRLGLLPPHFSLPPLPRVRRGLGTLLRIVPPAAALCTLGRVLEPGIPPQIEPWLRLAGALGALVGGVRWAAARDALEGRRYLVLGLAGLGILGGSLASAEPGQAIAAAGSLLFLVGAVASLNEVHTPTHRVWPVAGALMLAGLAWTPGGMIAQTLATGAVRDGAWLSAAAGLGGMVTLSIGVLRGALAESTPWPSGESLTRMVYGLGLALPVLVAVGLGVRTPGSAGLPGAAAFGVAAGLGALVILALRRAPARRLERWRRFLPLLDSEPFYEFLWRVFSSLMRGVRAVGEVLEGEGALLWTYVIVIMVLLAVR